LLMVCESVFNIDNIGETFTLLPLIIIAMGDFFLYSEKKQKHFLPIFSYNDISDFKEQLFKFFGVNLTKCIM